jgi:hypothetical protein
MNKYDLTFGPFQYPDVDESKMEANFYGRFADYLIRKGFIPSISDWADKLKPPMSEDWPDMVGPEIASTDLKTGHFYIGTEKDGTWFLAYINNIDATDWRIENEDGRRISLQSEGKHRMGIIHLSLACLTQLTQLLETAQEWSLKDPSLGRDIAEDWGPLVDYSSMTEEERAKVLTQLLHKLENRSDEAHTCQIGWMPVTGLQYMEEWKDLPQEIVDDLLLTHDDYYGENGYTFYEINLPPLRKVYGTSDYGLLNWWW